MKKALELFFCGILLLLGIFVFASLFSPWPQALLIRWYFETDGAKVTQALEKYVPTHVNSILNEHYDVTDNDAYLDVYYPKSATQSAFPVIVWVHGGGFVSGNKEQVGNYLKILASYGFTTVSVGYSIAPEKQYPLPVIQVNKALGYLNTNAEKLHIDKNNIILAGDSAGALLAAQVATLITNPAYASDINIQPEIKPEQIKGTVLACGPYDLALLNYNGVMGWFLKAMIWSYTGQQEIKPGTYLETVSVINYVNSSFPSTFITAGNVDPLEPHSIALAEKLQQDGVPVETLFYPKDYTPPLAHEYQFNLDSKDGRNFLDQMVMFAKSRTQ